jgi:hypothetical protein
MREERPMVVNVESMLGSQPLAAPMMGGFVIGEAAA